MKKKNAFINAANGIVSGIRQQLNLKIQLAIAVIVTVTGMLFSISTVEWLFIAGCCMLVISLELLNTAVENICDLISKDFHPLVRIAKDTAAGAVLVASLGSAVTELIIFLPKIIHYIKSIP